MAQVTTFGVDSIEVTREDDEAGSVVLVIRTEGGTDSCTDSYTFYAGRFFEDAENLARDLRSAANDAEAIVSDWQDRPDEYDGFVSEDRGRYLVSLDGVHWNGDALVSVTRFPDRRWRSFPTRDIATYELARAMEVSGVFPNVWYQNERGSPDNIGEQVRAFHDEGGTNCKPLSGVEYEDGADVLIRYEEGFLGGQVVKDYGELGIVYVLSGDDEERFSEDRSEVKPYDEDEGE